MYRHLTTISLCLFLSVVAQSAPATTRRDQRRVQEAQAPKTPYVDPYANEPPYAYDFGYSIHGDDGFSSYQREMGDHAGRKTGAYSYQGADGIYRTVTYVADEKGFRATIHTNEPGTSEQKVGDVKVSTSRRNQVLTRVNAPATTESRRMHTKFELTPLGQPKKVVQY